MKIPTQPPTSPARQIADPPLSAARAFVVQFREETAGGRRFSGRVEHMTSGHAARFESAEELCAFLDAVLAAQPSA